MFKVICTFMILFITLAILCSNNVESRTVVRLMKNSGRPQHPFLRMADGINNAGSEEDGRDDFIHTKRKSEFLSALYALPYGLVDSQS